MNIAFDAAKNVVNIEKHGLSFVAFDGFDDDPVVRIDDRYDYGETRFVAIGRIAGLGHCIIYTVTETGIRLISFRRAHEKEMRRYDKATSASGL